MADTGKPVGLVLAGGLGRRMGRTKGDLVVDGRPLAERAALSLEPVVGELLISVRPAGPNPAPGRRIVADPPPAGRGPLAGIDAAFAMTGRADLLVLACDYPDVETELLRQLVARAGEQDDVVLPVDASGRDDPLVGLWRRRAQAAVRAALGRRSYRVGALLEILEVRRLGADGLPGIDLEACLRNLNRPGDLPPTVPA